MSEKKAAPAGTAAGAMAFRPVAELGEQLEEMIGLWNSACQRIDEVEAEREAIQAEVERLRRLDALRDELTTRLASAVRDYILAELEETPDGQS